MRRAVLKRLLRELNNLDYTRRRMEKLYLDERIALRDLHSVYESLFLRGTTSFEQFLQDLFVSILDGRTQYRNRGVLLRMRPASRDALMDILMQGDNYLDWLPYDKTIRRAEIYLRAGKPFSDLDGGERSKLKTITMIRNAIAHKSTHAARIFEQKVIGSQALLRGERKPAGYLRSLVSNAPIQNRFEVFMGELARIASLLC